MLEIRESFVRPNYGEFLDNTHKIRKLVAPFIIPTSHCLRVSPSTFKRGPKQGAPVGREVYTRLRSQPTLEVSGQLHQAK